MVQGESRETRSAQAACTGFRLNGLFCWHWGGVWSWVVFAGSTWGGQQRTVQVLLIVVDTWPDWPFLGVAASGQDIGAEVDCVGAGMGTAAE